jgi:hypothetical protein
LFHKLLKVQLRAIALNTNKVIAIAEGIGGASLLHVPMVVDVPTDIKEGDDQETPHEATQSPVVIEVRLDETKCDVPVALQSLRPYHYPARQEGDHKESYLNWEMTTLSGGYGIELNRDRTIEEREKLTRATWEERQPGRAERAKSKRTRYKALLKPENPENPETKEEETATAVEDGENATTTTTIPDGMDGLDEEERKIVAERREKMNLLPPIVQRKHVIIGNSKNKMTKIHYVAKPNQYLDGVVSTSNDDLRRGIQTRSTMLTDSLIEKGRRKLISEKLIRKFRKNRLLKIQRIQKLNDEKNKFLYPEVDDADIEK